jgi:1,5-anhydro-D-fructose reductase (1,5-anhydro-D-mannitol-forming)
MHAVRWALIGASDIAGAYVLDALRADPRSVIVGVLSRDASRGEAFATHHGLARAYRTPDELWTDDAIDAVYVSTQSDRHRDDAVAAATAGKHVLCEKPLAATVQDATEIVDVSASAGVLLGVNHNLRGAPAHREAARVIATGAIGEVITVRVFQGTQLPDRLRTWRLRPSELGGGAALDLTVHTVDVLRFLLADEVRDVTAVTNHVRPRGAKGELTIVGVLRFDRGTLATFHDSFVVPFGTTSVELYGTHGYLRIGDAMADEPIATLLLRDKEGKRSLEVGQEGVFVHTVRVFNSAVQGDGTPLCTGLDGLRAVQVVHAALTSAATGRQVEVAY